jgi:indole-3-glycerol phosphate synthase
MSTEGTYLDKIIARKRSELAGGRRPNWSAAEVDAQLAGLPEPRDFKSALQVGMGVRAIAEFKRASPSEGTIREPADPQEIALAYQAAGAAAISVLCDAHFRGSLEDLKAVREAVDIPVLCKDFIVHRSQIIDARLAGADAILLIVAALEPPMLRDLFFFARQLGLYVLVEAHTEHEIERALAVGAQIVGINNRDLQTFELDVGLSLRLRAVVPSHFVCVAESGIRGPDDVARLREARIDAMLVGTHLMRAEDPGRALTELLAF